MVENNGVKEITPSDGKIAADGVFASNNDLLDKLKFDKCTRFIKLIDLSKAEKTFVTKAGSVVTAPDHFIQLNAVKELCKLAGDYPAEKFDIMGGNITVISKIERDSKPGEFKDASADSSPADDRT
ncbi:MAG: hypothetical protein A2Z08_07965 [Deltaproteobacteria bacterium RBG_16_54_11]|nr:MAG: hypothetical protein A2Z08_07965 [Deltaproteobacteria bacterium RBG_16_54_11]